MPRARFSSLLFTPADILAWEQKQAAESGSSGSTTSVTPAVPGLPASGSSNAATRPPNAPNPGDYRRSFLDASAADAQASSDVRFGEGRGRTMPVVR